jgi:hypothetical protein
VAAGGIGRVIEVARSSGWWRVLHRYFPFCVYCGRLLVSRRSFRERQAGHLCSRCPSTKVPDRELDEELLLPDAEDEALLAHIFDEDRLPQGLHQQGYKSLYAPYHEFGTGHWRRR